MVDDIVSSGNKIGPWLHQVDGVRDWVLQGLCPPAVHSPIGRNTMRSLLTILCLFASSAHAVPGQFTHQGRLLNDDGSPKTGEASITFRVINAETGGTILWKERQTVLLNNGFYAAVLGADETENPLNTAVLQEGPVWLELQLDGEGAMFPRSPIHAVPYATISTMAKSVSGGPVNATELAVDGTPVVDASGNWVGPAPIIQWDDISGMPADFEDGVDDESDSFAALGVSCLEAEIPVWDSVLEEWGCGIDQVLSEGEVDAMVADNGYSLAADVAPQISSLLAEIETLKEEYAALEATVEEGTGSSVGTVMYGSHYIANSVGLASMEGFTEITGDLEIRAGDIPNLESLSSLTKVGGTLIINDNGTLTDLSGLRNLESIGGYLQINNNASLVSLEGLNNIESIASFIQLEANESLISLEGLNKLTAISGGLTINNNDALTNVDALALLETVGSYLQISNNASLEHLNGLSSLQTIGADQNFSLHENDVLNSIAGLESLTEAGRKMAWYLNPELCQSDADALVARLRGVGWPGTVSIHSNKSC